MSDSSGRTAMVQGRIVWGIGRTLFEGRPSLDMNTKLPRNNKAGQPMTEFGFGLAVPKEAFAQVGTAEQPGPGYVWAAMQEEAFTIYPSRQVPPAFAWKYDDGDGIDSKGVSFAQREGYAGCIILKCTTTLPIKWFKWENNQNIQVSDGIKVGDYVRVQLQIKVHPAQGQGKPGLYLNPNAVQLLGYGKEIVNTPSGDQIFGLSAPAMPQGASAMPVGPTGMIMPSQPGMAPVAQAMPPQAPQAPGWPQQPVQQPQAHYGVVPPVHQPVGNGYPSPVAPLPTPMGNAAQPAMYPPQGYPQQPMSHGGPALPGPIAPPTAFPSNPGFPQR